MLLLALKVKVVDDKSNTKTDANEMAVSGGYG